MKSASVLGVPMYTLAAYSGMGRSPSALREAGVIDALGPGTEDLGDLVLANPKRNVGPPTARNFRLFVRETSAIGMSGALKRDGFSLVLGGECSLIVGELQCLEQTRNGRIGLLWMDSHGDFNVPSTSPSGYIGGMCLAFACGRGPLITRELQKMMPLIGEERLVHLGSRALDAKEERMMRDSEMQVLSMKEFRRLGAETSSRKVAQRLSDRADSIVCHFDVDVLDPSLVPSVNYPTENGLKLAEAVHVIRELLATGKLSVLNLTAYNADRDTGLSSAKTVVSIVSKAFGKARK